MERHQRRENDDTISIRSGRSDAISDIEDDRSRSLSRHRSGYRSSSRVRDTVEKLVKEKTKLKNELKKYANELKSKTIDHQVELENTQGYFQEQITALTEEKDDLLEQVGQNQDVIFQEKEKLRNDFRRKIASETKRLESRLGGKNSTNVNRLNSTISKLQSQLSQQSEESERQILAHESQLHEKGDACQKQIENLTDRLFQVNQTVKTERSDMRKMTLLLADEKEAFKRNCQRDSENDLERVLSTNRTTISTFESVIGDMERKMQDMEKEYNKSMELSDKNHNTVIKKRDMSLNKLTQQHIEDFEKITQNLNSKYQRKLQEKDVEISDLEKKMVRQEDEITYKYKNMIANAMRHSEKIGKDCAVEIEVCKQKLLSSEQKLENDYKSKSLEFADNLKKQNILSENALASMKLTHKTTIRDLEITRENAIKELENENQKLGSQVSYIHTAMENMETDTDRVKKKFIETLNTQNEEFGKVLHERDEKIEMLENKVKVVYNECSDKITYAKSQLQNCEIKLENEKQRCVLKDDQLNQLNRSSKRLEEQADSISDSYEKRVVTIHKECELDIQAIKNTAKEELDRELSLCRKEYENEEEKSKIAVAAIYSQIQDRDDTINKMKIDSEEFKDIIQNLEIKLALVKKSIDQNKQTYKNKMDKMEDIYTNKIASEKRQSDDKHNLIVNDLTNKLKSSIKTIKSDKVNTVSIMKKLQTERDDYVTKLELTKKKLEARESELRIMNEAIKTIKSVNVNTVSIMNKLQTERDDYVTKLELTKKKLEARESELRIMSEAIGSIKRQFADALNQCSDYKKTLSTIEDDHKIVVKKLSIRPRDNETEKRLKKMRDDCLNSLKEKSKSLDQMKDHLEKTLQKLSIAEAAVHSKNEEFNVIGKKQIGIKQTFINSLNTQQASNDKLLAEKQNIIESKDKQLKNLEISMKQTIKRVSDEKNVFIEQMKEHESKTLAEKNRMIDKGNSEKEVLLDKIKDNSIDIAEKKDRITDLENILIQHLKKK